MKYKVIKYISEIVCINKKDVTPLDVLIALDLKEKYDFRPSEYYINASGEMVKDRGHCDCGNRDLDNVIFFTKGIRNLSNMPKDDPLWASLISVLNLN